MIPTADQSPQDKAHDKDSQHRFRDETLGWEGHVHVRDEPALLARILRTWPELRTGLAFIMVFVTGVCVGSGVTALWACRGRKTE